MGDPHQTEPVRALVLARAVDALPPVVIVVGCQVAECDELKMELSPAVAAALPLAIDQVISLVHQLCATAS